jgi:hypothetical protein
MKGFVSLPMIMIIWIVAIFSVFIFFALFKVHINSVFVDAENLNRYQEVPTTIISSYIAIGDEDTNFNRYDKGFSITNILRDLRPKEKINCFTGNGPAGKHGPVQSLCTKRLPNYFTKLFAGIGGNTLTGESVDSKLADMELGLKAFEANLRLSLPGDCFSIQLGNKDKPLEEYKPDKMSPECDIKQPKLDVSVPIPVLRDSNPDISYARLVIGKVYGRGENFLVTWPEYRVEFEENTKQSLKSD